MYPALTFEVNKKLEKNKEDREIHTGGRGDSPPLLYQFEKRKGQDSGKVSFMKKNDKGKNAGKQKTRALLVGVRKLGGGERKSCGGMAREIGPPKERTTGKLRKNRVKVRQNRTNNGRP